MNQSITKTSWIVMMLFLTGACTKESTLTTEDATIVNIRYACGPACDASIFSLKIGMKYFVSSEPLQDTYRQQNLPVTV